MANDHKMRVAVIVSDAVHLVNAGGDLVRTVRMFDLPDNIASYIRRQDGGYTTVTLALEDAPDGE